MYNSVEVTEAHMRKIKLLKISEAAQMLSVNPETLRRWDRQGILKPVRIGSRGDRRYLPQEIQKKIKSRKVG